MRLILRFSRTKQRKRVAKLYADENFPLPTVIKLRQLGHDLTALVESEEAEQAMPDDEVLNLATSQERILLTLNRRDFIRLHNEGSDHAGIVVCTFDADFVALAERIHEMLEKTPDMSGQLVRVNRPA